VGTFPSKKTISLWPNDQGYTFGDSKKLPECLMPDARVKGCYIMALAHSGVRGVHFFMEVASRKVDGWLLSMVDMP